MEQLLVTLADVQSEDVATVADVLVDMGTTSPRKKLSLTNKHGDSCGKIIIIIIIIFFLWGLSWSIQKHVDLAQVMAKLVVNMTIKPYQTHQTH